MAPPPAQGPRRRKARLFGIVAAALALLCLGGGIAGFLLYDRATAPDRSAPDVVVDNYLRAFLVDRNDTRANLFTCNKNPTSLEGLDALRADLQARENRFQATLVVSWGALLFEKQDALAEVKVDLTISAIVDGITQGDRQSWRFVTRLEEGWRVCEGVRV